MHAFASDKMALIPIFIFPNKQKKPNNLNKKYQTKNPVHDFLFVCVESEHGLARVWDFCQYKADMHVCSF
jgi:hypothetical protein